MNILSAYETSQTGIVRTENQDAVRSYEPADSQTILNRMVGSMRLRMAWEVMNMEALPARWLSKHSSVTFIAVLLINRLKTYGKVSRRQILRSHKRLNDC